MRLLSKAGLVAGLCLVAAWGKQDGALDHSLWDTLLKQYVTPGSRVDYRRWKAQDQGRLDAYLSELGRPWPAGLSANAQKAAWINAYNAFTIRWILSNYPVVSIWRTPNPFGAARHVLNGEKVSLDTIEHRLRAMHDPRIHAALVCASRGCPPLRREAYTADRVDEQLDENTRAWLANPALNEFFPDRRLARVSSIFKWFARDFEFNGGSVQGFLARYAPAGNSAFLKSGEVQIEYLPYQWGLNDTSSLGQDYSGKNFLWDRLKNIFQ